MFVLAPILVMIIVTVTCVLLICFRFWYRKKILRFWFGKDEISPDELSLVNTGRGLGYIIYVTLSLFLIDTTYRLINTDLLNFGHPKYFLTTLILTWIYCSYILIGTVFSSPTWKTLVTFIVMCVVSALVIFFSKTDENITILEIILYPLIAGVAVEFVLNIVDILMKKKNKQTDGKLSLSKPVWNISDKLNPIYSVKWLIVMYLMFCAELILLFEGTTMLFWL